MTTEPAFKQVAPCPALRQAASRPDLMQVASGTAFKQMAPGIYESSPGGVGDKDRKPTVDHIACAAQINVCERKGDKLRKDLSFQRFCRNLNRKAGGNQENIR